MRIHFKRIEIHNFKSFGDEAFDFEAHSGLNLICGKNLDVPGVKNGSGKTNLVNALVFSLFGQTQNNSRNCNIANKWLSDKEVRVATYFEIDRHKYKVVSGFNKYSNQYCELSEIADGQEIVLTRSTMSETRSFLENEILHCDKSIFLRTVLLSSDQNYNFFMLRKGEKKEFIEKLFDITVFGDMYNHMHYDLNQLEKQLIARQNKLMLLSKNNDEYVQRSNEFEAAKAEQLKTAREKLANLKQTAQQLKELNVSVNEAEVKKYELAAEKVSEACAKLSIKQKAHSSAAAKLEVQQHKAQLAISQKQSVIDKHAELLSKLCEDCKPIFKDYYSISSYADEITKLEKTISELSAKHEIECHQASEIDAKISDYETTIEKIQAKLKKLTAEKTRVESQIAKADAEQGQYEREIAKIESALNPYAELRDQNSIELNTETTELNALEERHIYLKFAESIVSQDTLRKFIISDLVGLLNNKIKTYLTKFGAKYEVVFDADMNYTLVADKHEFDYGDFSGGERSRLMIAACFAFRDFMYVRNNFSSNILFLDEFIDGAIDSVAISNILEILSEYSKQYSQNIFIISHRKSEMDNTVFDHIIQVVKEKNISRVTYLE